MLHVKAFPRQPTALFVAAPHEIRLPGLLTSTGAPPPPPAASEALPCLLRLTGPYSSQPLQVGSCREREWARQSWIQILALGPTNLMTLGKLLNLLEPQFPQL